MFKINGVRYWTLAEVAEAAGKSQQTIRRWDKAGKIPSARKIESSGRLVYTDDEKKKIVAFANRVLR